MNLSTICSLLLTSPFVASLLDLTIELLPWIVRLGQRIVTFRQGPITPVTSHAFERDVHDVLREMGRVIVQWVYNHLERSDLSAVPDLVNFDHHIYRRRPPSPRRGGIATLFGIISLRRIRYEPCDAGIGLTCIFPLEQRLGIVMGKATTALANRVGMWTAQYPQETVLALLREEHGLTWSVATLRNVAAELSTALAPLTHQAQVDYVLALLQQAHDSKGAHRPVLSAGRDGIFVPIRNDKKYREAATATLAVLDRAGRRLGTVYLGHMPEPGQGTLTQQLTALLTAVLHGWQGPLPRLQYVTDGGHHPNEYFVETLQHMLHPRTGQKLEWQWVVDYYHACQYVTKIALGPVWQGNPSGGGVGGQDAPLAARQKGRHRPRAPFGGGARLATGVHARGTGSVRRRLRVLTKTPGPAGLLDVSPPRPGDRQRHHRSGVQDAVHTTLQTIRHEVVAGRRTSGRESARHLAQQAVERSLQRLFASIATLTTGN